MKAIKTSLILLCLTTLLYSQNLTTSSPYSMFGLGEYAYGLHGQNSAMGGVAYGMRNAWLINTENPAGLTGLDYNKLYFDASIFLKNEDYKSMGETNSAVTGNCSAFTVAGKIAPWWATAIGFSPYTSVGYLFTDKQPIEGTPGTQVYSTFEGEGGISKLSFTHGIELNKRLSVGINLGYLFGSSTQKEIQNSMAVENEMSSRGLYTDLGIQYKYTRNRNTNFTFGGVYGFKQKVSVKNTTKVKTISDPVNISDERTTQYTPQFIGVGASLKHYKTVIGVDYAYKQYSQTLSTDTRITFKNTHEIKAGISYTPEGYLNSGLWKRSDYKIGIVVSNPYYSINEKTGIAYRASIGMSIPFPNAQFNAALFYDRLSIKKNILEKNIIGITFTCTYAERLYKVKLK